MQISMWLFSNSYIIRSTHTFLDMWRCQSHFACSFCFSDIQGETVLYVNICSYKDPVQNKTIKNGSGN